MEDFAASKKSMLSTSEWTVYDDVSWDIDVTIDRNKRPEFFIAAPIIKNIFCKKKKTKKQQQKICAILSCSVWVENGYFFYLLQIKLNLIRKYPLILYSFICKIVGMTRL